MNYTTGRRKNLFKNIFSLVLVSLVFLITKDLNVYQSDGSFYLLTTVCGE